MKGQKAVFSSQSVHWATPSALYEELDREFAFNLDPCPLGGGETDGTKPLLCAWEGRRVYCNPPYGPQCVAFLERATEPDIAVFLVPARTDTRWFHDLVLPFATEVRFIRGRLKFGGSTVNAPFPSMLCIFHNKLRRGE